MVVADVMAAAAESVADELVSGAVAVAADVTSEDDVAGAVERAVAEFGGLDVMVNNAAVMGATGSIANLVLADVDRTVAVILGGARAGRRTPPG